MRMLVLLLALLFADPHVFAVEVHAASKPNGHRLLATQSSSNARPAKQLNVLAEIRVQRASIAAAKAIHMSFRVGRQ